MKNQRRKQERGKGNVIQRLFRHFKMNLPSPLLSSSPLPFPPLLLSLPFPLPSLHPHPSPSPPPSSFSPPPPDLILLPGQAWPPALKGRQDCVEQPTAWQKSWRQLSQMAQLMNSRPAGLVQRKSWALALQEKAESCPLVGKIYTRRPRGPCCVRQTITWKTTFC